MNEPDREPLQEPQTTARFQFGLKHLFVVTLWCAVLCAVAVQFGWLGGYLFALVSAVALGLCFRSTRFEALVVASVLLLFLLPIFIIALDLGPPRQVSNSMRCADNLRQIGIALLTYHNEHGCFPPAYIADESGRPIHSWRALILPYIEHAPLYNRCDFNEPWNGPDNSKVLGRCVNLFRCPSDHVDDKERSPLTNYVAVVGPGTAWPGGKSTKLSDFKDGLENTILLVEIADSGIHWAEPRDLDLSQVVAGINPTKGQGISSNHGGGARVLFADAHGMFVPDTISPEKLRALLTIDGGEPVDPEKF